MNERFNGIESFWVAEQETGQDNQAALFRTFGEVYVAEKPSSNGHTNGHIVPNRESGFGKIFPDVDLDRVEELQQHQAFRTLQNSDKLMTEMRDASRRVNVDDLVGQAMELVVQVKQVCKSNMTQDGFSPREIEAAGHAARKSVPR